MNPAGGSSGREQRTDPINRHVGTRLRLARKMRNLTQEALAERLGVTFQQVQKYENGTNRISASRLHQAVLILDVPVTYFFPEPKSGPPPTGMSEPSQPEDVVEWLRTPEGFELNVAFAKVCDPKVRRRIVQLVQSMAASSD